MNCPKCKEDMIWSSDFTYDEIGIEGDGIVSVYYCQNNYCSIEFIEVYENTNEEMS